MFIFDKSPASLATNFAIIKGAVTSVSDLGCCYLSSDGAIASPISMGGVNLSAYPYSSRQVP